jgi:hypothetical protein
VESHLQPTAPGKSSKKQKAFAPVAGPSHLENPSPDEDTLERTALGSELSVPRSPRPKKELEKSTSNLSSVTSASSLARALLENVKGTGPAQAIPKISNEEYQKLLMCIQKSWDQGLDDDDLMRQASLALSELGITQSMTEKLPSDLLTDMDISQLGADMGWTCVEEIEEDIESDEESEVASDEEEESEGESRQGI